MDPPPASPQYSVPGTTGAGAEVLAVANPNPTSSVAVASSSARQLLFVPPRPTSTGPAPPPPAAAPKGRGACVKRQAAAAGAPKAGKKPAHRPCPVHPPAAARAQAPTRAPRQPPPPPAPAPQMSARQLLDELTTRVDEETFMAQMNVNVGSSFAAEHGNGGDGEEEEKKKSMRWMSMVKNTIAQNLFKDQGRKDKKGRKILGMSFVLHHCYEELGNEEKWKSCDGLGVHNLWMNATEAATIIDDDASSDENKKRSSTPHSVAFTKRPVLGRKATKEMMKGKKSGDDDIAKAMDRMANARLEYNEDKKLARTMAAEAEARRVAFKERMAATEQRRLALEEKKVAAKEQARLMEEERNLFAIDTSNMDERQKEYINLARDEVLAKRRMMANYLKAQSERMNAFGGMGGYGGMGAPPGAFGGMGAPPGAFGGMGAPHGGYGGMGAPHGGYGDMRPTNGGYGAMDGMNLGSMGGMGLGMAPPGGFMASLVNPSPSTNVDGFGDSSHINTTNTTVQGSQEEETQNGSGNGYEDVDK